ncbi:MAG: DUF4395 domain-containing protein [Sideroxydans sp.]
MNSTLFQFGQQIPGYNLPVLNERAVRASAGIFFLFAIVSFMKAWLVGDFQLTRMFVIAFLIDFTIRIFINPRYSPSLILGQWFVRKQQPEYVGAPQKRFAWAIGFALAFTMFLLVVINNVMGPVNLIVCALCLLLLFFETAFGICLGCSVYRLLNNKPELCPGGVCEQAPAPNTGGSKIEGLIVVAFILAIGFSSHWVHEHTPQVALHETGEMLPRTLTDPAEIERCKVPEFAKAMGHETKWRLHNNCK